MTFLQLCQRLQTESGTSGVMTTTAGQSGELARVVNWVGDMWNELQTMRDDWDWMRASNILGSGVTFVPAFGQYTITVGANPGQVGVAVDSFGKWDRETFRCYTTATMTDDGWFVGDPQGGFVTDPLGGFVLDPSGPGGLGKVPSDEMFLDEVPFDTWRDAYMRGALRGVRTRPYVYAVGPDQSVNLGPPPNGLYTITADYWMAPTLMAADADVPVGLPLRYHMLIVYGALLKYGFYESAPDVLQRAEYEWGKMYRELESARLPQMYFAGALS